MSFTHVTAVFRHSPFLFLLALHTGCDGLSEERVRTSIPGTWVGSFTAQHGATSGIPRRLELRVFTNGQYNFLVDGLHGLEISHAGRWTVHTGTTGTIELVCEQSPVDPFEVLNLRTLRLFYQGTYVEFTRQ
jgi:hypothetical protein